MKIALAIFILIAVLPPHHTYAQYIHQGTITYERKVNTFAEWKDEGEDDYVERIKGSVPQFRLGYFELAFNTDNTCYKRIKMPDEKPESDWGDPAKDNTVVTDFKTGRATASKAIFEKTYLVKDTIRHLQWKVMSEVRTIAGFKCRKAVSKICDSVYVVAFYTTDIPVSGGPELFAGLPGMIMELAIPRLHTTWNATKIETAAPDPAGMQAPHKGRQVTSQELYDNIKDSFSDWGKSGARYIWWSLL